MAEKEYVLNGIRFTSSVEYQNAKKEQEGIAYIIEKNDMSDDKVVLALYNKFVNKNVFRTQIGHNFLKELQERLMRSEVVDKSEVARLPIYEEPEDVKQVDVAPAKAAGDETVKKQAVKKTDETKNTGNLKAALPADSVNRSSVPKSNVHMEYVTGKPKKSANDKKLLEYRSKYKWSLFINIVLVIVIALMVYITLNSKNINIINYEERLQNEYAAWAEELADREEALNRREHELNLGVQP